MFTLRLSGPILDRIDLYCLVYKIEHDKLLTQPADPGKDKILRQRIIKARRLQARRLDSKVRLNADMTTKEIKKLVCLIPEAIKHLNRAASLGNLSARAYLKTIRVARTIADLEDHPVVTVADITEALHYNPKIAKALAK